MELALASSQAGAFGPFNDSRIRSQTAVAHLGDCFDDDGISKCGEALLCGAIQEVCTKWGKMYKRPMSPTFRSRSTRKKDIEIQPDLEKFGVVTCLDLRDSSRE
jgi:hypothetical protein